jgi:hypothetical protein
MAKIKQTVIDEYEDAALKGLKAIKDFLAYQGDNPMYFKKARVGAVPVSSYTKLRGTEANMDATHVLQQKMVSKSK